MLKLWIIYNIVQLVTCTNKPPPDPTLRTPIRSSKTWGFQCIPLLKVNPSQEAPRRRVILSVRLGVRWAPRLLRLTLDKVPDLYHLTLSGGCLYAATGCRAGINQSRRPLSRRSPALQVCSTHKANEILIEIIKPFKFEVIVLKIQERNSMFNHL